MPRQVRWTSHQRKRLSMPITTTTTTTSTVAVASRSDGGFDEAQQAAAAFLARYRGPTLHAYRYDLRAYFQWALNRHLVVLAATRPQIERYRPAMEEHGLAASMID